MKDIIDHMANLYSEADEVEKLKAEVEHLREKVYLHEVANELYQEAMLSLQSQLEETQHKLDISEKKVKLNYDSVTTLEKQLAEKEKKERELEQDYTITMNVVNKNTQVQQSLISDLQIKLAKAEAEREEFLEKYEKDVNCEHQWFPSLIKKGEAYCKRCKTYTNELDK
jgi:chromosome segregation ATPase